MKRCILLPQQRNPTAEAVNTVWGSNGADVSDPNGDCCLVWRLEQVWLWLWPRQVGGQLLPPPRPGCVSMSNGSSPGSSLSGQIESRCGVAYPLSPDVVESCHCVVVIDHVAPATLMALDPMRAYRCFVCWTCWLARTRTLNTVDRNSGLWLL